MKSSFGFLQAVRLNRPRGDTYPFNIPAIAQMERLELHANVTFLIGENGSGKSTLIEALAVKWGMNAEGGGRNFRFSTHETHSGLHEHLTLERNPRYASDHYFLRAESFYNLATEVERLGVKEAYVNPAFDEFGGRGLHEQSHGQSFFSLLQNRLRGDGFYIFDEPEAALSPQRQMAALTLIDDLVRSGSQLIIATHSPIIMAYPHAMIYELGEHGIRQIEYEETEHVQVTRNFLNRREQMLRVLLDEDPPGST